MLLSTSGEFTRTPLHRLSVLSIPPLGTQIPVSAEPAASIRLSRKRCLAIGSPVVLTRFDPTREGRITTAQTGYWRQPLDSWVPHRHLHRASCRMGPFGNGIIGWLIESIASGPRATASRPGPSAIRFIFFSRSLLACQFLVPSGLFICAMRIETL